MESRFVFKALLQLRKIEAELLGKKQHKVIQEALPKIDQARSLLYLSRDSGAQKLIDEVTASLSGLVAEMGDDAPPELENVATLSLEAVPLLYLVLLSGLWWWD